MIELIGLKYDRPANFDGKSLLPLLDGRAESLAERRLVVQYGPEFKEWNSAVLWKRWRLVKVVATPHGATHAKFELPLRPGEQHRIEGQFLDAAGEPLRGATYVLVQPILH